MLQQWYFKLTHLLCVWVCFWLSLSSITHKDCTFMWNGCVGAFFVSESVTELCVILHVVDVSNHCWDVYSFISQNAFVVYAINEISNLHSGWAPKYKFNTNQHAKLCYAFQSALYYSGYIRP